MREAPHEKMNQDEVEYAEHGAGAYAVCCSQHNLDDAQELRAAFYAGFKSACAYLRAHGLAAIVDETTLAARLNEASLKRLHELALSVTRGDLRRPWSVQTSNSFRRLGTDRGDGNVLCAVNQPSDGHPDLHAAPHVLDYIVAAHPFVILQLIRERASARYALHLLRHKIAGHDWIFQEAGRMAGGEIYLVTKETDQPPAPMDRAATTIRAVIADLTDRSSLRQAWEEIDAGIRREIVESWEEIVRGQLPEIGVRGAWEEIVMGPKVGARNARDPAGDPAVSAPVPAPIASYVLGQCVTFHPGRGDRWYPGRVTRLESGLRADLSAWHRIFVSSTRDLPDGEWEHASAYQFEDHDAACVRPASGGAV